jgi:hypothetical protein
LIVDESYAFDYLSILHVKCDIDNYNLQNHSNFDICKKILKDQLGHLFDTIFKSKEYLDCYNANYETFQAVNSAKKDLVPASYVDKCNFKRHQAKIQLQLKYFGSNLTETKIGYEIYEKERGL